MWQRLIRRLILVLVGLAFLGAATVQAMPPGSAADPAAAQVAMPGCTDAAMGHDASAPESRKGITPDCLKLMQCLGTPDMPAQAWLDEAPVTYVAVAYWSNDRRLSSLSYRPALFPPKSA